MIKIKKLIPFFLIIIFLNNCGYTPKYALNKNINFSIELIELKGDRDFNNSLKSKLTRYEKKDNSKKNYEIKLTSEYKKQIKSKEELIEIVKKETNLNKYLKDNKILKIIFVPKKLINIII